MKRWSSFVKDLDELRRHAISIELEEDPMRKSYRLNDDIWFSGDHGFVVDPPSLLKDFHEKWKTGTKPLTVGALFEAKGSPRPHALFHTVSSNYSLFTLK